MRKVLNNKVLLFIVAILLLANIAILFYFLWMREPSRRPPHGDHQKSPMTEFLQSSVGFNTEQLAAFETMRQKHRLILKPLFEDIRKAKVEFYGFLTNPRIADSTLNTADSIIGERQKVLDMQTFQNFKEIRSLCTTQQQPIYDSLIVNEISKMWFPSWKGNGHQEKEGNNTNH